MKLSNWTATPSGGAITITGTDEAGQPAKLRNVKRIAHEPRRFGLGLRTVAYNGAGGSVAVLS